MCKFKYVIIPEKGLVSTRNHLDLIISAYNNYYFWPNMKTCVLKLWQDMELFQDTEVLVLNPVEINVEEQDMELFQDMEAQYHTYYIAKPLVKGKNYGVRDINYTTT